jgi:uncharacterized membrane protein
MLAMFLAVLAMSAVGWWKFAYVRYGGMDLAIFTNVLWNLSYGNGWYSSIQGGSYLGDHVAPILLLFIPLFRIWSDPRMLIFVQAIAIAAATIPIFFLAHRSFRLRKSWATTIAALWLINALVWNSALFEFHALAFAPFFVLSAAYAYHQRRMGWSLMWLMFAVAVREDVALIVAMFGAVAFLDGWRAQRWGGLRSAWMWIVAPIIIGFGWFFTATTISAAHAAQGAYPFLAYYGWLGDSFRGVFLGVIQHPLRVLVHIVSIGTMDMMLGLLMPFLFLPLIRPKWLLLILPPLAQFLLGAPGANNLVVELHYGLLFLPGLTLATLDAVRALEKGTIMRLRQRLLDVVPIPAQHRWSVLVVIALAASVMVGPWKGIATVVALGPKSEDVQRRATVDRMIDLIPASAPVIASAALLPRVATRTQVATAHYAALGISQFAARPYPISESTEFVLLDRTAFSVFPSHFASISWASEYADGAIDRFIEAVAAQELGVIALEGDVVLLGTGGMTLDRTFFDSPKTKTRSGELRVDDLRDIVFYELPS